MVMAGRRMTGDQRLKVKPGREVAYPRDDAHARPGARPQSKACRQSRNCAFY
jgi:hypothetical protein